MNDTIRPGDIAWWYDIVDEYGNDVCELFYLVCGVTESDDSEYEFMYKPERHITIMFNVPKRKMEYHDNSYVLPDSDTKNDMKIIRFDET